MQTQRENFEGSPLKQAPRGTLETTMQTQRENFEAWCLSRESAPELQTHPPSKNFKYAIGGGPGNIFDHGFVAGGFPVWGREMFEACPVEFVLVGEPYRDPDTLRGELHILTRNGFKVWILDGGKFHDEGVTTFIAAATDPVICHPFLIDPRVGGLIPACDYYAFFPRDVLDTRLPLIDGRLARVRDRAAGEETRRHVHPFA